MSLQIWLPFLGNADNQGLLNLPKYSISNLTYTDGKLGGCSCGHIGWHLNSDILANAWSVATWYKASSFGQYNNIIFCKNIKTSDDCQIYFSIISNTTLNVGVNGPSSSYSYSFSFSTNTWYHLAATYDGNTVSLYINGAKVRYGTVTTAKPEGRLNIQIDGRSYDDINTTSTGGSGACYNDFRLYDECLSAKQIKLLSQGLVAHYTLNGSGRGCDNILTNSSGYNGTSDWGGLVSVGNENGTPYLISKRTDTTTTSRTFVTHSAITSLVSSWATGDKFTMSGYYRIPSNETYAVQANMFIRWGASTSTSDTGFYTPSSSAVVKDTWIRFEYTFEVPSYTSGSSVNFYLSAFSQGLSTVHWKYLKLEKGDKATPWLPNSSDAQYSAMGYNDTTIYDSSGYNYHGKINTTQTVDSNTARYSVSTNFNGTDNAIKIPFNAMLGITTASKTDYTISVWTYKTAIGSKGYQTIFGGPSGFELEARNAAETNPVYVAWNWGKNTGSYAFNEWTLFTFVHTTSDNKIYVNGELASSGSSANIPLGDYFIGSWRDVSSQNYQGNMSDFRIYATALSADDIKELYQVSASIDKSGNMYAYEFNEV
jgi:hypothetical protein